MVNFLFAFLLPFLVVITGLVLRGIYLLQPDTHGRRKSVLSDSGEI